MQNITLRFGQKGDARRIIDVHRRAIHKIAADDYSQEILNSWGRILSEEELNEHEQKYDARIEKNEDIIVVAEISGKISGFGEIALQTLEHLESLARKKNLEYLRLPCWQK